MSRIPPVFLMLAVLAAPAAAQEAWLVTYGPGQAVEERFGHNALWMRDPTRGVDQVYNFGFFDFDQPGFYTDYAFGRMTYFAAAQQPRAEFEHYRTRGRSIRIQLLNLDRERFERLLAILEHHVHPEHRDFRYDYYFNNCSNRIRDVLDEALGRQLLAATMDRPASQDFRAHSRRLVEQAPLLYLGIHAGLGRLVDRPRSVWEEMFLPEVVAREAARLEILGPDGRRVPLVVTDRMLHEPGRFSPPETPGFHWPIFAGLGLVTALLVLVPAMARRPRWLVLLPLRLWLLASFAAGAMLLFLWLFTAHEAAWRNENLLLFNPLLIALWRGRRTPLAKACAALVLVGLAAAGILKAFPGAQWNYDLMLWLVPAQLAALAAWWRAGQGS